MLEADDVAVLVAVADDVLEAVDVWVLVDVPVLLLDDDDVPVLVAVTEARASATQPKFDASTITDPAKFKEVQDAQAQLSGVLGRLLAISENYPDLKSNQNFLALQSQLEGTENRISVARRDYNEAVRVYNTELRTFPGSIWAATFYRSSKPIEPFAAAGGADKAPEVKF